MVPLLSLGLFSFFSSLSLSPCSRGLLRGADSLPSSGKWSLRSALSRVQVFRSPIPSNSREGPGYIPLVVIAFGCFIKLTKRLFSLCFALSRTPPHQGQGGGKERGLRWKRKVSVTPQKEASRKAPHFLPVSQNHAEDLALPTEGPKQATFPELQGPYL